jgi:hypothetical protein
MACLVVARLPMSACRLQTLLPRPPRPAPPRRRGSLSVARRAPCRRAWRGRFSCACGHPLGSLPDGSQIIPRSSSAKAPFALSPFSLACSGTTALRCTRQRHRDRRRRTGFAGTESTEFLSATLCHIDPFGRLVKVRPHFHTNITIKRGAGGAKPITGALSARP